MTEIRLQSAIKEVLETEIIPELSVFKPGEMKVFLQDIPWTPAFEKSNEVRYDDAPGDNNEENGIDKHLPCCIVRLLGGETKNVTEGQTVTVGITVNAKDDSEDMSGYQKVMIVIDRIRNYFDKNIGIRDRFRKLPETEWGLDENTSPPYYVGAVITKWQIPVMPYGDYEHLL